MVDKLTQVRFTFTDKNGKKQEATMKVQKNFVFDFKNNEGNDIGSYRVNDKGQFVDIMHPKKVLNQFEITEKQFKEYESMAKLVKDGGLTQADKDEANVKETRSIVSGMVQNSKEPESKFKWYNPLTWF